MNRWSDLPEDFYLTDKPDENKSRIEFLSNNGIDINDIPESMYENLLWLDENNVLINKANYNFETICIKDVVGTTHRDYGNMPLIKAFKRLKRNAFWCDRMNRRKSIPYHVCLRRAINWKEGRNISCIKLGDKFFIYEQGNHRLITYKILYLSELNMLGNPEDIEKLNKKYAINIITYDATATV